MDHISSPDPLDERSRVLAQIVSIRLGDQVAHLMKLGHCTTNRQRHYLAYKYFMNSEFEYLCRIIGLPPHANKIMMPVSWVVHDGSVRCIVDHARFAATISCVQCVSEYTNICNEPQPHV